MLSVSGKPPVATRVKRSFPGSSILWERSSGLSWLSTCWQVSMLVGEGDVLRAGAPS